MTDTSRTDPELDPREHTLAASLGFVDLRRATHFDPIPTDVDP
jgi:hypothetical protein